MVRHHAIGVEMAQGWYPVATLVIAFHQLMETSKELHVVFIVLKNILTVKPRSITW
jgi:hypothetical protein